MDCRLQDHPAPGLGDARPEHVAPLHVVILYGAGSTSGPRKVVVAVRAAPWLASRRGSNGGLRLRSAPARRRASRHGYPLRHVFLPWCAREGIDEPAQLTRRAMERFRAGQAVV